jgi:hypothetical protein
MGTSKSQRAARGASASKVKFCDDGFAHRGMDAGSQGPGCADTACGAAIGASIMADEKSLTSAFSPRSASQDYLRLMSSGSISERMK